MYNGMVIFDFVSRQQVLSRRCLPLIAQFCMDVVVSDEMLAVEKATPLVCFRRDGFFKRNAASIKNSCIFTPLLMTFNSDKLNSSCLDGI